MPTEVKPLNITTGVTRQLADGADKELYAEWRVEKRMGPRD